MLHCRAARLCGAFGAVVQRLSAPYAIKDKRYYRLYGWHRLLESFVGKTRNNCRTPGVHVHFSQILKSMHFSSRPEHASQCQERRDMPITTWSVYK